MPVLQKVPQVRVCKGRTQIGLGETKSGSGSGCASEVGGMDMT